LIRLLAIDIDGTLLDSRGACQTASRCARRCVRRDIEGSPIVTAATVFISARPIGRSLPIPLTLIVNNGAVVKRKTGENRVPAAAVADAARQSVWDAGLRGQRAIVSIVPTSVRSCSSAWTWRIRTDGATTRRTKRSSQPAPSPLSEMLTRIRFR